MSIQHPLQNHPEGEKEFQNRIRLSKETFPIFRPYSMCA